MLDYTIFGESHGPAVGVLVTGAAPGLRWTGAHRPGASAPGPPWPPGHRRREPDRLRILSGVYNGHTTGDPICLILENRTSAPATTPLWRTSPAPATPITPPMSAAVAATTPGAAGPIPAV